MVTLGNFKVKRISFLFICLITIFALILRLDHIKYPSGLWSDEMFSYFMAKESFPLGIINELTTKDVHLPFYFFILHFWINLFGDSDVALRSLSVLFGVLNVPIIYLLGKEIDSEKTGLIAALFVAINSFLIYYSQEVRFYSFLPFMASLSVLLAVKTLKNINIKNLLGLVTTNTVLIFTHPFAIYFVAIEILVFSIDFFKKSKSSLTKFLITQITIPFSLFAVYSPLFLLQIQRKYIQGAFTTFDLSHILIYVENWFSPAITGLYSNNFDFYNKNSFSSFNFFIYIICPILIALLGLIIVIYKKYTIRSIFIICVLTVFFEILTTLTGLSLVCKYTIIILPLLLLVVAYGLSSIKNKLISCILITLFLSFNLLYIFSNTCSVLKIYRYNGFNIPITQLKSLNIPTNKKDIVFCNYSGCFLSRYYNIKDGQVLDYSVSNVPKVPELTPIVYDFFYSNSNMKYFTNKKLLPPVIEYANKNIINKLDKNRFFIFIVNLYEYSLSDEEIVKAAKNGKMKGEIHLYLTSKITNDIRKIAQQHYKKVSEAHTIFWDITVYQNK